MFQKHGCPFAGLSLFERQMLTSPFTFLEKIIPGFEDVPLCGTRDFASG